MSVLTLMVVINIMISQLRVSAIGQVLLEEGERSAFVVAKLLVEVGGGCGGRVLRRVVEGGRGGLHAVHREVLPRHQHLSSAHDRAAE